MSKESRQRAARLREGMLVRERWRDQALRQAFPVALAVGLVALVVYALTCSTGLAGGDTGELTVVALTGGIAHPPGYPLFTLLGWLFGRLPLGEPALRIALLSSVSTALAAALLTAAVTRWSLRGWAGATAGLLYAFAPLIWTNATLAEVFALNNLAVAALVYLSVRFHEAPSPRLFAATAFVFGLGLSNHHTVLFFGGPLALAQWARLGFAPGVLARGVLAGACGLLPYLYLPLSSRAVPLMAWGDLTTWSGFWTHLTRAEYGSLQLSAGSTHVTDLSANVGHFLRLLPHQLLWVLFLLPLLAPLQGPVQGPRPTRTLGWLWTAIGALYVLVFSALSNINLEDPLSGSILERFWQAPLLLVCVGIGLGLASVAERLEGRPVVLALPWVALGLGLFQGAWHYRAQDRHARDDFDRYARATLEALPPRAILLTSGDHFVGAFRYQQLFKSVRTDVMVMDQAMLSYPWAKRIVQRHMPDMVLPGSGRYRADGYHLTDFLAANYPAKPVFTLGGTHEWDVAWQQTFENHVVGSTLQLVPKEVPFDAENWRRANERYFEVFDVTPMLKARKGTWEYLLLQQHYEAWRNFASEMMRLSTRDDTHRHWLRPGLELLEKVISLRPEVDPIDYKNLGVGYEALLPTDPSAQNGMVKAYRNYLKLRTAPDPELPAIEASLARAAAAQK